VEGGFTAADAEAVEEAAPLVEEVEDRPFGYGL